MAFITDIFNSLDLKWKILLVLFIGLVISIPAATLLISQRQKANQSLIKKSAKTPIQDLGEVEENVDKLKLTDLQKAPDTSPSAKEISPPTLANLNVGSTLTIKILMEGRTSSNQAMSKVFIGLASSTPKNNPTYLLTFSADFPASGVYKGLSLAGLTIGSTYTAYIKAPQTISSASAFQVTATETNLNGGNGLNLTAGDLNDDNAVTSTDYNLAKSLSGTTPKSANWNERADITGDGVVNSLDLGIIRANIGKVGAGGAWQSTPAISSPSAKPKGDTGGGYWIFVPQF